MQNLYVNAFVNLALAYLMGAIPFGLVLTKLFGKGDLRRIGSGNIGATNVVRTQGKILGFLTFFFDFAKGFVACWYLKTGNQIFDAMLIAMPVIGHVFPVWLRFHGGRGFAAYLGVLLAAGFYLFDGANIRCDSVYIGICVMPFASTLIIWGVMFCITRVSAFASVLSTCCSLAIFYYIGDTWGMDYISVFSALIVSATLVLVRHYKRVKELLQKEMAQNQDSKSDNDVSSKVEQSDIQNEKLSAGRI